MPRFPLRSARVWLPTLTALTVLASGATRSDVSAQTRSEGDLRAAATGFHELLLHDPCTGDYVPQPDTCLHERLVEKRFTFGGNAGVIHDVRLRIRGLFEPTTIEGGETPTRTIRTSSGRQDKRQRMVRLAPRGLESQADVLAESLSEGLTHDLRRTLRGDDSGGGGSAVVVRVVDGNDRQIDNGKPGLPDRRQTIGGVVDRPLDGQLLHLDVINVTAR